MIVRSLLRRAGVFALATAGCAALTLAPDAANAAVRGGRGFAGYSVYLGGGYGGPASFVFVTTTFRVPKLSCGSADQAIAPTAGATVRNGLSAAALFIGCHGGKAHYWPELELSGHVRNYRTKAAHAGDTIVLWLNTKSGHVSVADKTHKFKVSRAGRPSNSVLYAWIGDEGWANTRYGRLERVPDFGTLTYSNSKLYRRPLGQPCGGCYMHEFNRTSGGTLQIETSPLFSGGTAFSTYFKHH